MSFFHSLTDADECTTSIRICDENADCKNTLGSYSCSCKTGFSGEGHTCKGRRGFMSELTYLHHKCSITSQIWSFIKQVLTSLGQLSSIGFIANMKIRQVSHCSFLLYYLYQPANLHQQILMNVSAASSTAMIWLYVPILWDPSPAHVTIRT